MAPKRKADSGNSPPVKKSKVIERTFQESWKSGNSWLSFDSNLKSMFCELCLRHKKSNSFTSGCMLLKKDNVTKHAKSKDHLESLSAAKLSNNMQTARETAIGRSEAAITAALRNVYFTAKNNLANRMVPELNALCIQHGVNQFSDLRVDQHTTYETNTSICDFQDALAGILREDLNNMIKDSVKYSCFII